MTAKTSTRRYVPHHLASTIDRVESGVASSTSRLPRARSSASAVGAVALSINSPKTSKIA